MELLEMKIGANLTKLRKKKGLTQDQLAEKLGVSAPAVSKWERDTSYPDITLLCPLARALDTNVDTLLQFEEDLPDQKVTEIINQAMEKALQDGYEAGEHMISDLLRRYPSSVGLKFHAAAAWNIFPVFFPTVDEEIRLRWTANKKELLSQVRASQTAAYWQTATLQLAEIAIAEGQLKEGEQLLKELPEYNADSTAGWSLLYLKKEEPEEALKTVQKRLFSLVRQVQTCLTMMLNPEITDDNEAALKICEVYRSVDQLFGLGGMYDGLFLEIYLRMNRYEEAADCFVRYADVITGDADLPRRFLFTPGLDIKETQPAASKKSRQILLQALQEDERFQPLLSYPQCKAAIEKIKASL